LEYVYKRGGKESNQAVFRNLISATAFECFAPKLEGRQMIMMIAPGKKKSAAKAVADAAPAAAS
jgi:translation initiation factor IF-3